MNHDPELPNGFQDADLEMAELTRYANRAARLRKQGICDHGWIQGPPGPPGKPTTVYTCNDCGKAFPTLLALEIDREEMRELMI